VKDINSSVQKVLEELVIKTDEIGLQVAAYLGGELVIDTWAGLSDETSKQSVNGETLFTGFSISKGGIAGSDPMADPAVHSTFQQSGMQTFPGLVQL
jgi:hypothetical protein